MNFTGIGKAFTLSLVETAIRISNSKVPPSTIKSIIELGKDQLNKPNHLLIGVNQVLETLEDKYTLIVATKGDLLDQERKLKNRIYSSTFIISKL